jgi:lipopolysaccharide biosynthesis glycosyltransferase
MNRSVLHVAITPDDHYVHHGIAMLNSLRQNNRYHRLFVHIIYGNLSFSSRLKLIIFCFKFGINYQFYRIQSSPFDSAPLAFHFSSTVYNRLLLASYLDVNIEKVLYLDCDLIILKDLSDLYEMDLGNNYLAAVEETISQDVDERLCLEGRGYFNAGVLLLNLKAWRQQDLERAFLQFISEKAEKIKYLDQDVLNYCSRDHWIQLDRHYNVTHFYYDRSNYSEDYFELSKSAYEALTENPSIVHFSGHKKPWIEGCDHPKKDIYFKYELSFKKLLFSKK